MMEGNLEELALTDQNGEEIAKPKGRRLKKVQIIAQ